MFAKGQNGGRNTFPGTSPSSKRFGEDSTGTPCALARRDVCSPDCDCYCTCARAYDRPAGAGALLTRGTRDVVDAAVHVCVAHTE